MPVNEERLLTQNATAGHATIRMPALRALRPRTYRLTTKVIDKHGRAAVARRIVGI